MKKIIYLLAAAVLFSATPVMANCGMCPLSGKGSSSENWVEKKMEAMKTGLGLSDEQATKIEAILNEKMESKKAIMAEKKEKMDALRAEYTAKIDAVLDDEQKAKHAEMKAKRDKGSMKGSGHEHKGSDHEMKGSGGEAKGSGPEMKGSGSEAAE